MKKIVFLPIILLGLYISATANITYDIPSTTKALNYNCRTGTITIPSIRNNPEFFLDAFRVDITGYVHAENYHHTQTVVNRGTATAYSCYPGTYTVTITFLGLFGQPSTSFSVEVENAHIKDYPAVNASKTVNTSTPLCNDGSYELYNSAKNFPFSNLAPGPQPLTGRYDTGCNPDSGFSVQVTVYSNPCNFDFSMIGTSTIQNCSPGGITFYGNSQPCATTYNISIKDHNNSTIYSNTIAAAAMPFKVSLPLGGHYSATVIASSPYNQCTTLKEIDLPAPSVNFFQASHTQANATKHGFSDGSVTVSPVNDSNDVFLKFWPVPYKNSYTYYIYDAAWNLLANGQSCKPFTFTGLAAGTYNVLTIGNRFDAQFCMVPENKVITITEPACSMAVTATSSTIQQCSANVTGSITNYSGPVQVRLTRKATGALVATTASTNGTYLFSGLDNAAYTVTATDSFNCSASANITITNQFCTVPTGLIFTKTNSNKGTVSWLEIDCSLGYNFQYRQKYPASAWVTYKLNGPSNTSKPLTGLFPGTVYEFQVRAICTDKSNSVYSPIDIFCTVCPTSLLGISSSNAGNSMKQENSSKEDVSLTLHPVPARQSVNLTFSAPVDEKGSITVYNIKGQTVLMLSNQNIRNNTSVDVSRLGNGAYMLSVILNRKRITAKLIIEK